MKEDIKKQVIRRLKIIEGQVRGVQRMVEREDYCVDILNQASAIKEGLSSIENLLLKNHLSTHVVEQIKSGESDRTINEMLALFKMARRK